MKAFLNLLRAMFTLTPVWVDKGGGRWAMRRRMHPLLRAVLAVTLMLFGIAWGLNRLMGTTGPGVPSAVPETPPSAAVPVPEEPPAVAGLSAPEDLLIARPARVENPVILPHLTPVPRIAPPPRSRLGNKAEEYWVHISKGDYTLSLYRGDELVKSYSVAVGRNPGNKQRVGDYRTPVGEFRVRSIENSQSWKHDFGDGNGMIAGAYGPWFIRLETGWKGIGIHGTHDPDSRGSMATEGCIRMSNEEVQELRQYAYRNMKVVIEE